MNSTVIFHSHGRHNQESKTMIKLRKLLNESATVDAYEWEQDFSSAIGYKIGESPRQCMELLLAVKRTTSNLKTVLTWTEEEKDGRGSRFNKETPLKLRGFVFKQDGVTAKITSISLINTSSTKAYNTYTSYSYNVKISLKYN